MCVYTFPRIKSCLTDRRFPNLQGYMGTEGLRGCMGTLGYLAPEVVTAGLSNENAYTDKCDIWSLGVTRWVWCGRKRLDPVFKGLEWYQWHRFWICFNCVSKTFLCLWMLLLLAINYHELVDRLRLGGCTPCALSQKRNKFRSTFPSPKKQQKATLPSHPLKLRSCPASQRRWFLSSC